MVKSGQPIPVGKPAPLLIGGLFAERESESMQDSLKPLTVITLKESPGNAILVGSIARKRVLWPACLPVNCRLNRRRAAGVVRTGIPGRPPAGAAVNFNPGRARQ